MITNRLFIVLFSFCIVATGEASAMFPAFVTLQNRRIQQIVQQNQLTTNGQFMVPPVVVQQPVPLNVQQVAVPQPQPQPLVPQFHLQVVASDVALGR